jgi:sporulation transcriptional regulator SpoIIID
VGCIFFSDKVEKFIPPKKGRSHILAIIRELVGFVPESNGTAISEAVRYLTGVNKKRCTAFLLSDFLNSKRDDEALNDALKIATSRHDIVALKVSDPREREMPDVGIVELQDAETARKVWVDTSSMAVRDHYAEKWAEREEKTRELLLHNRIDIADISTDSDYVAELIKLFNDDIENRVLSVALYVSETGATVRSAAKHFGISKSTVHKDLTDRLKQQNPLLFCEVSKVLAINRAERHIRGGNATKMKYEMMKK